MQEFKPFVCIQLRDKNHTNHLICLNKQLGSVNPQGVRKTYPFQKKELTKKNVFVKMKRTYSHDTL